MRGTSRSTHEFPAARALVVALSVSSGVLLLAATASAHVAEGLNVEQAIAADSVLHGTLAVRLEQHSRGGGGGGGGGSRGGGGGGGTAVPRGGGSSGSSGGGGQRNGGSQGGSTSGGNGGTTTQAGSGSSGTQNGGTATGRTRDGRPAEGQAVERRGGGRTVVVGGGYYGGFYPWGWGGLGFGGFYGIYDPWWYEPYPPAGGYEPSGYGYEGSLRLRVSPRDAEVWVDGYFAGSVDDFDGAFQSLKLDSGPHRIEIRLDGYEPLSFDVRILPNRTINYKGELHKTERP